MVKVNDLKGTQSFTPVTFDDNSKLFEDISSLYLSEKLSDVTLIVGAQKFPAHKTILAVRNAYFKHLLYEDSQKKNEVVIKDVSPEGFRNLLKYTYTGSITFSNYESLLQVFGLTHKFSFPGLENDIKRQFKSILNLTNIIPILNAATQYNLDDVRDACLSFIDVNALEIVSSDSFQQLTRTSIVQILKRSSLYAPEIKIFTSVAQWCRSNNEVDGSVMRYVRLSSLTLEDLVTTVMPTKLVDCENIFQAVGEILDLKVKLLPPRALKITDENLASPAHKAEVVAGTNTSFLLTGNRELAKHASHIIDGSSGIIVKLGDVSFLNCISLMLWDGDLRFYNYYIEVSLDQKKWHRVIDYSRLSCRSVQTVYFEEQVVQYIKIASTFASSGENFLALIFVEAYFKTDIPKIINGIVRPESNVATPQKYAVVIEGRRPETLLNGEYLQYDNKSNFTAHAIGGNEHITIQLGQPYIISFIKLLLWAKDDRNYSYFIETSINKKDWEIAVDRRNVECKEWQELHFKEKVVVYIRITGTKNSVHPEFHCVHFECYFDNKVK